MAPAGWVPVEPEDDAARLLTSTLVLTVFCVIIVPLRVWCRVTTNKFGVEDWLMCIGFVRISLDD